jgi:hypothetical protein
MPRNQCFSAKAPVTEFVLPNYQGSSHSGTFPCIGFHRPFMVY